MSGGRVTEADLREVEAVWTRRGVEHDTGLRQCLSCESYHARGGATVNKIPCAVCSKVRGSSPGNGPIGVE